MMAKSSGFNADIFIQKVNVITPGLRSGKRLITVPGTTDMRVVDLSLRDMRPGSEPPSSEVTVLYPPQGERERNNPARITANENCSNNSQSPGSAAGIAYKDFTDDDATRDGFTKDDRFGQVRDALLRLLEAASIWMQMEDVIDMIQIIIAIVNDKEEGSPRNLAQVVTSIVAKRAGRYLCGMARDGNVSGFAKAMALVIGETLDGPIGELIARVVADFIVDWCRTNGNRQEGRGIHGFTFDVPSTWVDSFWTYLSTFTAAVKTVLWAPVEFVYWLKRTFWSYGRPVASLPLAALVGQWDQRLFQSRPIGNGAIVLTWAPGHSLRSVVPR